MPELRKKFPSAQIDFLVRKPYHIILEDNPYLDNLLIFENGKGLNYALKRFKLIRDIRNQKYDLIIDQIRNAGSAQITFFSKAKYRLGIKHKPYRFIYNVKPEIKKIRYHSAMKFDLLEPLGISEKAHKLYYNIRQDSFDYVDNWLKKNNISNSKLVCISPGSPVKEKKWSPECYAELADMIISGTPCEVLFLWGPKEKSDVDVIMAQMKEKSILAPPTSFNQAGAMLKRCELLICNDGGLNHLSAAMEVPSIAIFGKHKPTRWSPVIFGRHYHFHKENNNFKNDPTFGIKADEILESKKLK